MTELVDEIANAAALRDYAPLPAASRLFLSYRVGDGSQMPYAPSRAPRQRTPIW